jgi:hypothetical protein
MELWFLLVGPLNQVSNILHVKGRWLVLVTPIVCMRVAGLDSLSTAGASYSSRLHNLVHSCRCDSKHSKSATEILRVLLLFKMLLFKMLVDAAGTAMEPTCNRHPTCTPNRPLADQTTAQTT